MQQKHPKYWNKDLFYPFFRTNADTRCEAQGHSCHKMPITHFSVWRRDHADGWG